MTELETVDDHAPAPVVTLADDGGIPTTTSFQVAEYFGKEHRNVCRDIRNLLSNCPEEWGMLNFEYAPYVHPQNGKTYPSYKLTKDGFALLAMGFTGTKALAWKIRYIEAFNAMESVVRSIREKAAAEALLPLTDTVSTLSEAVASLSSQMLEMQARMAAFMPPPPRPRAFDVPVPHICELVRRYVGERGITYRPDEAKSRGMALRMASCDLCVVNSTALTEWMHEQGWKHITPTRVGKMFKAANARKTSYPFRDERGLHSFIGYAVALEHCGIPVF